MPVGMGERGNWVRLVASLCGGSGGVGPGKERLPIQPGPLRAMAWLGTASPLPCTPPALYPYCAPLAGNRCGAGAGGGRGRGRGRRCLAGGSMAWAEPGCVVGPERLGRW